MDIPFPFAPVYIKKSVQDLVEESRQLGTNFIADGCNTVDGDIKDYLDLFAERTFVWTELELAFFNAQRCKCFTTNRTMYKRVYTIRILCPYIL